MPATIKDVADRTGLAISTISKYINGGPVREKNRILIEKAIAELEYTPNISARSLRSSKSYTVGLFLGLLRSPHTSHLLEKVEGILTVQGYNLIYGNLEVDMNAGSDEKLVDYLLDIPIDGLIAEPQTCLVSRLQDFYDRHIPVVLLEEYMEGTPFDYVGTACCKGTYALTEYLIRCGHEKIAVIAGPEERSDSRDRLEGFLRAMKDYCLPVPEEYILNGEYRFYPTEKEMDRLWSLKDKPTGLVVCNYDMTQAVMAATGRMGIKIPEELSIAAFDDFEISKMVRPRLTAVSQPLDELAETACDILMRRMQGDYSFRLQHIRLDPTLHIRESVRKL